MSTEDPLLAELREELSQQRVKSFFKNYGKYIAGGVAALLIGVISNQIYTAYADSAAEEAGDTIFAAVENYEDESTFKTLAEFEAGGDIKQIANILQAKLLSEKGEIDEAVENFSKISTSSGNDEAFRDLAALNEQIIKMNIKPNDEEVEAELKKLTSEDKPFRYSALEALAVYYAENDKKDELIETYRAIAEAADAPQTMILRARDKLAKLQPIEEEEK